LEKATLFQHEAEKAQEEATKNGAMSKSIEPEKRVSCHINIKE